MFTGIISQQGVLQARREHGQDQSLTIEADAAWLKHTSAGDSISVNGVCLTATTVKKNQFAVDVSAETLRLTTLGELQAGATLNLELALRASDFLGGHLVSGHVDATAKVLACEKEARSERIWIDLPAKLAPLVAVKGNICVDGTSLTVNEVASDRFGVNIVPHTLESTIIGHYQPGTRVNLEVDLLARYVARILEQQR